MHNAIGINQLKFAQNLENTCILNFQLFYRKQFWQTCVIWNNKDSDQPVLGKTFWNKGLRQAKHMIQPQHVHTRKLNKCAPVYQKSVSVDTLFYLIKKIAWHSYCLTHCILGIGLVSYLVPCNCLNPGNHKEKASQIWLFR